MYAAAGGASLASRQARQRQRQQKKTQQLQAKLHPPKASILSVAEHGASTPTRGPSRQFHQLPTSYLRAPQGQSRKLSSSYTTQSKLLLPIEEGDTQSVLHMRMHSQHGAPQHHSHSHGPAHQLAPPALAVHGHQHHQFQPYSAEDSIAPVSPRPLHRLSSGSSASFQHVPLPKSATASLPLVTQAVEPTPPTSPADAAASTPTTKAGSLMTTTTIAVPHHDAIIVTPATPMASPGHVPRLRPPADLDLPETADEKQPLTAGSGAEDESDESMQPPARGTLERKCSVYRMRRSDAHEYQDMTALKRQFKELQLNQQQFAQQQQQHYEPIPIDEQQLMFKGLPSGRKWQICAYCEEGICVCEHIECAQGRAAWLERGRRCSVQEAPEQQAVVHRRWVKRNRVQDVSLGGSSDEEDFLGVLRGPSTFANAFLYVGLGTIALGLVIAFVGTGEKGFKTVELRLIGPSLIGLGLICCILRILFCICPSHCISSKKKARKKLGNKVDADHTTSLLRGESKRVSIARGHTPQPKYPLTHRRSQSKMLNDGMEALRQLATTSLFMQNEQKTSLNRVVPVIKEPEHAMDAPLEMKKLVKPVMNVSGLGEEDKEILPKSRSKTQHSKSTTTTTTTSTAIDTKPMKTRATTPPKSTTKSAYKKQTTITSEADEVSSPCLIDNKKERQQTVTTTTTTTAETTTNSENVFIQETSLMVIEPNNTNKMLDSRPSTVVPLTTTTTTTTKPQVPTTNTGAISRIPTSLTSYDLPPSKPHTYAAARSADRGDSPLIRGPLGMPLSALTGSSSTYAMPSTSYAYAKAKSIPASTSAPGASAQSSLYAATTAAPAANVPTTLTGGNGGAINTQHKVTFATKQQQQQIQQQHDERQQKQHTTHIPGQVLSNGSNATSNTKSIITTAGTTTNRNSTVSAFNKTSSSSTSTSTPSACSSPPLATTSNASFMLSPPPPVPVASASLTIGRASISASKLEPELLLSPAKLGQ